MGKTFDSLPKLDGKPSSGGWFGGALGNLDEECKKSGSTNICITALLALRCKQLDPIGLGCALNAPKVPGVLDITRYKVKLTGSDGVEKEYNLPVIFTRKLMTLILDPKVQSYLEDLPKSLQASLQNKARFSLFDFTRSYAGTSEKAIEWLAVIFQDTSWVRLNHRYLIEKLVPVDAQGEPRRDEVDPKVFRALLRMNEALEFLLPENFFESGAFQFVDLYPGAAGDTQNLNYTLYHYYPMAYLAAGVNARGAGERFSFFLSFLFNAEYEFQSLAPDRWPFNLPNPGNYNVPQLKDLYAGYAGALFGINRVSGKGFTAFSAEFNRSPLNQLRSFLFAIPQ